MYFYVIYNEELSQRSFLYIRDQKKYDSWVFDWTVLFYKLVYKTKRSTVIGLISSESTPYYGEARANSRRSWYAAKTLNIFFFFPLQRSFFLIKI